ncbi:hypothetical protein Zm00014a_022090 [Zea mays]|uniref:RNI-like superfamily protein n=1 Tax=Zea mays TaxID=4577 RepID=A0A3L6FAB1_MAIZE|nr:hypothetical protein Zm00014a_022090 [Zea mays]
MMEGRQTRTACIHRSWRRGFPGSFSIGWRPGSRLSYLSHSITLHMPDTVLLKLLLDLECKMEKDVGCEDFNSTWQLLFKLRWPLGGNTGHNNLVTVDWQQKYWEKHLQECLNEAAEHAFLPFFCGSIAKIMNSIYQSMGTSQQHSRLAYQCSKFGCYQYLPIMNILLIKNTHDMIEDPVIYVGLYMSYNFDELETARCSLHCRNLCLVATMQAGKINVHKNYIRPRETLLSLEFIHCQLYPTVMDKICMSVYLKGSQSHGIQQFSIKSSQICETKPLTISSGLFKILSSGKSLHLLSLRDIKMQSPFARMIIHTLLESSCDLHTLEISENNIAGWLSELNKCSTNLLALKSDIFMNSLSVLNLRENNLQKDDVVDLHKILIKMPNLRDLDISGNPVMDEGIRSLIPFISWSIQKENPLLRLTVENCELSSIGVIILLECLTNAKQLLDVLSIADNHLGSSVAAALARFLGSHVRALNATDIGLGTVGFQILEETLPTEVALSHINISKNRGGIRAAYFVSRLICRAPDLVSVNAAGNLLPPESLEVICNSLKQGTCNLERVDLTGNMHLSSNIFPAFLEFKKHGKPILVVPPNLSTSAPYDDDP